MPLAGWRMLLLRVDHGSIFDSEFPSLFRTTLSSAATLQADFFSFRILCLQPHLFSQQCTAM